MLLGGGGGGGGGGTTATLVSLQHNSKDSREATGATLVAEWSNALPPTAHCLTPLRVYPDSLSQ